MKKVCLAVVISGCIVVFALLAAWALTNEVKANPTFVEKYPITVSLISPADNASFLAGSFSINFSLDDVAYDKIAYRSHIPIGILVKVDDNEVNRTEVWFRSSIHMQDYSLDIANITEGKHSLQVLAHFAEQTDNIGRHFVELSGSSQIVTFFVEPLEPILTPLSTPSSNLTLPTSTPNTQPKPSSTVTISPNLFSTNSPTQQPTIEPSPTPNNTPENFTPIIIIVALVTLAIIIGVLVYLKRRENSYEKNTI